MGRAGGRRAETNANVLRQFRLVVFCMFSFSHRLHCAALVGRAGSGSPPMGTVGAAD
ncbi:hypothetical protein BBSC_2237 [Bifidobacterium scardovii JCM 12489 = DSM 13734]|nr:hypothetical protein BBSC_2237 [Bifidobacterium scardovii JCM 12489 = DSM 13734]